MKRTSFRALLAKPRPLISPMAHDALSARLIELAGFEATGVSGSGVMAAHYALPDVGLAGLGEMLDGARMVARGTTLPWGADADDGFGDARSVIHTVRSFEALGCGQLIMEDQLRAGKRPGDGGAQILVSPQDMVAKLRAALATRDDREMLIIARTDSALHEGIDGAIRRAETYLEAGADGIFVAGLETPEQLQRVGTALHGAMQMAVVGEKRIRTWPNPTELYDMGFRQISYPGLLINRVFAALKSGLSLLDDFMAGQRTREDFPDQSAALAGMATAVDLAGWEAAQPRFSHG